jgi:hypothetical protein
MPSPRNVKRTSADGELVRHVLGDRGQEHEHAFQDAEVGVGQARQQRVNLILPEALELDFCDLNNK